MAGRPTPDHKGSVVALWQRIALLGLLLAGGACGDDGAGAVTTVAPPEVAGSWRVTTISSDGEPSRESGPTLLELEPIHGEVVVDTNCGSTLGAFSLLDDGRAGLSLTGGSDRPCDAAAEAERQELLDLLAEVDAWSGDDEQLLLSTRAGDQLLLSR